MQASASPHTPSRARPSPTTRSSDTYLLDAPAELVCPLTLAPFIDPVLTAAGHVYERAAIQAHLERGSSCTDPLTRQPLLNKSLTPVYVLRSRSLEYRESVAAACIERVCGGGPPQTLVRFLRRAVELIADTGSSVQGLSKETVDYIKAHPSNAFDRIALQLFAQGLYQSGYRDRAAAVYSSLLLEGADRMQQAELLRRCLGCWIDDVAHADDLTFQSLVAVLERSGGGGGGSGQAPAPQLGWEELLDVAQAAQLGDAFVLRLCEQLLFRRLAAPPLGPGDASPRGGAAEQEKRLLLKYVHVLTSSLQRRQSESERRLLELERWRRQCGGGSRASMSDDGLPAAAGGGGKGGGGAGARLRRLVHNPALVSVCMMLAVALPADTPPGRLLRAAPLLALLPK